MIHSWCTMFAGIVVCSVQVLFRGFLLGLVVLGRGHGHCVATHGSWLSLCYCCTELSGLVDAVCGGMVHMSGVLWGVAS